MKGFAGGRRWIRDWLVLKAAKLATCRQLRGFQNCTYCMQLVPATAIRATAISASHHPVTPFASQIIRPGSQHRDHLFAYHLSTGETPAVSPICVALDRFVIGEGLRYEPVTIRKPKGPSDEIDCCVYFRAAIL